MPKIHELITEDTWIKGDYTRIKSDGRISHCAVGWMLSVYADRDDCDQLYCKFNKYIHNNYPSILPIIAVSQWNDNVHRTYNEVYTAFKACDL